MVCKNCGYAAGPDEKLDHCPMCDARWEDAPGRAECEAGGSDSWKQHSGMYITAGVVVVGLVLTLVLVLGGRGGGSGGGSPAAGVAGASGVSTTLDATGTGPVQGSALYTDSTFGYTFEYPAEWQVLEGISGQGAAGAAASGSVSVVDAAGSVAGADHVDLVHVSVYELTASVDASMMDAVRPEVEAVVNDLQSQRSDALVVETLTETTAAGMTGFKVTLSFAVAGVPITSTMYFLFSGTVEYQLTIQAATDVWQNKLPALEALVASFSPGAPGSAAPVGP